MLILRDYEWHSVRSNLSTRPHRQATRERDAALLIYVFTMILSLNYDTYISEETCSKDDLIRAPHRERI